MLLLLFVLDNLLPKVLCINTMLFDVVRYFGQFWKRGSRDRNTFSVTFSFSSSNKGVPSHSSKIKDTTQTRIITLYTWDKRLSQSRGVLNAVSNKKRLLSSHINFINRLIKINCVASYCPCSQYLTDWLIPSRLTRRGRSKGLWEGRREESQSLYPSIFSFASKLALDPIRRGERRER